MNENDEKWWKKKAWNCLNEPPICIHLLKRIGSSLKAEARCTHLWLGSISGAGSLMEVGFELAQLPSLSATQWEKYIQEHKITQEHTAWNSMVPDRSLRSLSFLGHEKFALQDPVTRCCLTSAERGPSTPWGDLTEIAQLEMSICGLGSLGFELMSIS